jgi:hypothetical protein
VGAHPLLAAGLELVGAIEQSGKRRRIEFFTGEQVSKPVVQGGHSMSAMQLEALTWNLFHGRDHPPNPALLTWRSRLLRTPERDATHWQVNRDLFDEFATVLASANWDVALLQECPPRWDAALAEACDASGHAVATSRNSIGWLRGALARANPDLIASNEGGSNLTLVRGDILDRIELVLTPGPRPERRVMAFTRARVGTESL